MIRSLSTAEDALLRQQVRIDALANNLANVNSTGFRQILTRVAEKTDPAGKGGVAATAQRTPAGGDRSGAPLSIQMDHAVDIRPGAVRATGRATDVALLDNGFFSVQTDAGERYTRAGSFVLNSQKQLTTPSGELVLGTGGPITIEGNSFEIESSGTVIVDGNNIGRLKVVDFDDATRLMHQGANLLEAPVDMPPKTLSAEEVVVAQGNLEGSNVDPVSTLVSMIEAQRAFEIQTRITSTEDEMLQKAVNNLPSVR